MGELTIYTDRIEPHSFTGFSHAIENAKALLEKIGKEICKSKVVAALAPSKTDGGTFWMQCG